MLNGQSIPPESYDGFMFSIDMTTGVPGWVDTYPSLQFSQTYGVTVADDGFPVVGDLFITETYV